MAKNAFDDYSTTAASNTDIDGVDSTGATGLVKSGDNYTRSVMSHAKAKLLDLGAVNTVAGTGDAVTVTLASNTTAFYDGMRFSFNAPATNTGAATIAVKNSAGTLLGTPKIRKWASGVETALSAGDMTSNHIINVVYDSARDTAAGAFMIDGSASVAAATTSAAGILKLATLARTLAGTVTDEAVPPAHLYFPTGHLYGLTLTNAAGDATNDIVVAAGTARDASDSYNYILASAYTKQIDAAWALGSAAGGLDTGSVGNSRYAIWGIGRSDTRVCDVLFSLSFSSPTMPANYDFKVLIGEFTRAGGVNGTPIWYPPKATSTLNHGIITPWVAYTPTLTNFGSATNITGMSRRNGANLDCIVKFTAGTPVASECRVSIGFNGTDGNVTVNSSVIASIVPMGIGTGNFNAAWFTLVLAEGGNAYVFVGRQDGSNAGLTKATGAAVVTTGGILTLKFSVPITGWQ